ncbi:MAG TPA: phospholipase A [Candidatus Limisoma intestinavium]|uniref:Phosphatidylcholine 1-acylhydrolase n=1 Tax=Candidatus Limisoma intestinavium TaxID=2840856 RepID=A0A9D1ILE4_9BACT|nr:phospholipase A [Candidatus Limisoma intestinavium]
MKKGAILCLLLLSSITAFSQILSTPTSGPIDADSIRRALDNGPYFSLYKDNYFTMGTTVNRKPSRTNSDVKFQVSIAQRLTKSTLPFNTYLFLFYTQKCMWNVFEESMPMRDLNFNPGIGLAKHLFVKNRYVGKLTLLVEHESNGRDGADSRSWNKISLACNVFIDPNFMIHGKAWIPIVDGQNNKDILDYCGIYQTGFTYTTPNKRFGFALTLVKRRGWNLNYNSIWEINYRLFKKENQFLFLQYYNGYGENLLDYNKFHSRLRVGIVIKPALFSDF